MHKFRIKWSNKKLYPVLLLLNLIKQVCPTVYSWLILLPLSYKEDVMLWGRLPIDFPSPRHKTKRDIINGRFLNQGHGDNHTVTIPNQ